MSHFGFGNGAMLRRLRGAISAYAAYALADRFAVPEYWVAGTQYTPITALPGYSFTRSGSQGAVDASGAVQFFAANVPAINSAGYHAYGALTNYILQSQNLANASWSFAFITATANAGTAPDGTNTATRLVTTGNVSPGANASQTATGLTNGAAITTSIWVKSNTASTYALRLRSIWSTSTDQTFTADGTWRRLSINRTAEATTEGLQIGSITTGDANNYDILVWQGQIINGNFPNGGPLIVTTTAAASIGASALSQSLANGTYSAVYTFDDSSTQTVSTTIAAGAYAFPTNLNRNIVKQVLIT